MRSTSERTTSAPGAGGRWGASRRARADFPVPERPPMAMSIGARRADQRQRQAEIGAWPRRRCARGRPAAANSRRAAVTLARIAARSDRNSGIAASASMSSGAARLDQVAIEDDVGGGAEAAVDQVHQQEGEIVEDVAGGDQRIEFDGVERHRLAVDHRDIAEMEVAVAAAHQAVAAAQFEQRPPQRQRGAARARQMRDIVRGKQIGRLGKLRVVLVDEGVERRDPGRGLDDRRARVCRGDGAGEFVGEFETDAAALGEEIERARLVEAVHLDRPLDRLAGAVEREMAAALARDRDDAMIERGRERAIDLDLRLAGRFALVEGRVVEKGKTNRALDLERAIAGEKDDAGMRVDPTHRFSAMRRRIGEHGEDRRSAIARGGSCVSGSRLRPAGGCQCGRRTA